MGTILKQQRVIDPSKLSEEDQLTYYQQDYPDKKISDNFWLVNYALNFDAKATLEMIKRIIKENKTIVAYYPMFDTYDTSGMEEIGGIEDGALYLK